MGNLKLRAGYGYADDPLLSQVQQGQEIQTIGGVNVMGETYTSPMYGLFMSYFHLWKHLLSISTELL
jgi:hypothetical protein